MIEHYIRNVVEAALLAAGRPLQVPDLAQLFEEHERPDNPALRAALESLANEYEGRGIEVKETASGYRIQVRASLAAEISRLWPEKPVKYSRALLETLALIAYRQPITRAEIEAVRGVAVNPNILKTIQERNWVRVVGHREVPGRPELLGTTRDFLDYFGLKSLDELPALADLKALGETPVQLELPREGTTVSADAPAPAPSSEAAPAASDLGSPAEAAALEAPSTEAREAVALDAAALQAADPDSTTDPPSPFVEAVIGPPAPEPDLTPEPEGAPPPVPAPAAHEPLPDLEMPEEEEEDKPAADGKAGMAAGPRSLDE